MELIKAKLKIKDKFTFKDEETYKDVMMNEYVEELLKQGRLYVTTPPVVARMEDYFAVKPSDIVGIVSEFTEENAVVMFPTKESFALYKDAYLTRRLIGNVNDMIIDLDDCSTVVKDARFLCFDIILEEDENGEEREENVEGGK